MSEIVMFMVTRQALLPIQWVLKMGYAKQMRGT